MSNFSNDQYTAEILIQKMMQNIEKGNNWFDALLHLISSWKLRSELVGTKNYNYLIDGEAFDWLLLAERICFVLKDFIPKKQYNSLIISGKFPYNLNVNEFRNIIGFNKYRLVLNYWYGVVVELFVQLAEEESVLRDNFSKGLTDDSEIETIVFRNLYGNSKVELFRQYCDSKDKKIPNRINLFEFKEFNYWLFKLRFNSLEPARVASDTLKGIKYMNKNDFFRNRIIFSD